MIKGVILGLGKIALTGHIPAYLSGRVKSRIKITGGADISKPNREAFSKLIPGARVFSSAEEIFKDGRFDFVDICVPPHLHTEYIKLALKKSLAIICEKPFTKSVSEAGSLKKKIIDSKEAPRRLF